MNHEMVVSGFNLENSYVKMSRDTLISKGC